MRHRSIFSGAKDYCKNVALLLGAVLLIIIWAAVSMADGCPAYNDTGNVRSGSAGHSRYHHGGKY